MARETQSAKTYRMQSVYKDAFDDIIDRINSLKNVSIDMDSMYDSRVNDIAITKTGDKKLKSGAKSIYMMLVFENANAKAADPNTNRTVCLFTTPKLDSNIRSMRSPVMSNKRNDNIRGVAIRTSVNDYITDKKSEAYDFHAATSMMLNQSSFEYMFESGNNIEINNVTARKYSRMLRQDDNTPVFNMFTHILENDTSLSELNTFIKGDVDSILQIADKRGISDLKAEDVENAKMLFKEAAYIRAQDAGFEHRLTYDVNDICGFNALYDKLKEIDDKIEQDSTYVPNLSDITDNGTNKDTVYALSSLIVYKAMLDNTLSTNSIELTDSVYANLGEKTSRELNYNQTMFKNRREKYVNKFELDDINTCYFKILVGNEDDNSNKNNENNEINIAPLSSDSRVADYDAYRLYHFAKCENANIVTNNGSRILPEMFKPLKLPMGVIKYTGEDAYGNIPEDVKDIDFSKFKVKLNNNIEMSFESFISGVDDNGNILTGETAAARNNMYSNMPALKNIDKSKSALKLYFCDAYKAAYKYMQNNGREDEFNGELDLIGLDYTIFKDAKLKNSEDKVKNAMDVLRKQRDTTNASNKLLRFEINHLVGTPHEESGFIGYGRLTDEICGNTHADNPVRDINTKMTLFESVKSDLNITQYGVSQDVKNQFDKNMADSLHNACRKYIQGFSNAISAKVDANGDKIPVISRRKAMCALNDYIVMYDAYNISTLQDTKDLVHDICKEYNKAEPYVIMCDSSRKNIINDIDGVEDKGALYRPQSNDEVMVLKFFFEQNIGSLDDMRGIGQGRDVFNEKVKQYATEYIKDGEHTLEPIIEKLKTQALSYDTYASHEGIDTINLLIDVENNVNAQQELQIDNAKNKYTGKLYEVLNKENSESNNIEECNKTVPDIKF